MDNGDQDVTSPRIKTSKWQHLFVIREQVHMLSRRITVVMLSLGLGAAALVSVMESGLVPCMFTRPRLLMLRVNIPF